MTTSSSDARSPRGFQRTLVALILILGTVVSLLVSHSLENTHPGETTTITATAAASVPPLSTHSAQFANVESVDADVLAGTLLLCGALAVVCGIAFLIVFSRKLHNSRLTRVQTGVRHLAIIAARGITPAQASPLTVLCVSRT